MTSPDLDRLRDRLRADLEAMSRAGLSETTSERVEPPRRPARPPKGASEFSHQTSVLTSRYIELKASEAAGTLTLIALGPLFGVLTALAFEGEGESQRVRFVLTMIAVFMGTFSSCREVVKERLIFLRERRMGVSIAAFVASKVSVLAVISCVQCLCLLIATQRSVRFDTPLPLAFLVLLTISLAAMTMGLFLSSIVRTQNSLIALVPVALIPQLIFSDILLPNPPLIVARIETLLVSDWGLRLFDELSRPDPVWSSAATSAAALITMGGSFLILSGLFLRLQGE